MPNWAAGESVTATLISDVLARRYVRNRGDTLMYTASLVLAVSLSAIANATTLPRSDAACGIYSAGPPSSSHGGEVT